MGRSGVSSYTFPEDIPEDKGARLLFFLLPANNMPNGAPEGHREPSFSQGQPETDSDVSAVYVGSHEVDAIIESLWSPHTYALAYIGAGASVDAGLPSFRGKDGLYKNNKDSLFAGILGKSSVSYQYLDRLELPLIYVSVPRLDAHQSNLQSYFSTNHGHHGHAQPPSEAHRLAHYDKQVVGGGQDGQVIHTGGHRCKFRRSCFLTLSYRISMAWTKWHITKSYQSLPRVQQLATGATQNPLARSSKYTALLLSLGVLEMPLVPAG